MKKNPILITLVDIQEFSFLISLSLISTNDTSPFIPIIFNMKK